MKYLMILLVGVCLLLTSVPLNAQSEEAKQEVIKADRARQTAYEKGDGETWAQYISDDCIWANVLTGDVTANKNEMVTNINERGTIEPNKLSDEKIFMFKPNIVIQTGRYSSRFVRIWEKLDGRWQMIAIYRAPESNQETTN